MTRSDYVALWQQVGVLFGRTPPPERIQAAYGLEQDWLTAVRPDTATEAVRDLARTDDPRPPNPAQLHAAIRTRQRHTTERHNHAQAKELEWGRADDQHVRAMIDEARRRIAKAGGKTRPRTDETAA